MSGWIEEVVVVECNLCDERAFIGPGVPPAETRAGLAARGWRVDDGTAVTHDAVDLCPRCARLLAQAAAYTGPQVVDLR